MAERDGQPRGGPVLPLVTAFAALLVAQLVRAAWLPSVHDIPGSVHGEMLAAALGAAAAVLATTGGLELRERSAGGARIAGAAVAVAALVALAAEVVGVIAFASALGREAGRGRDQLRSLAVDAASVRAIAMLALAAALAAAAWPQRAARWLGVLAVAAVGVGIPMPVYAGAVGRALGSSTVLRAAIAAAPAMLGIALAGSLRLATAPAVETQLRAALARVAGAMMVVLALAAAGVLVAIAVFMRRSADPTGLSVLVALADLVVLSLVVVALLRVPVTGAARAALSLAAGALAMYLTLGLVHLAEVLRILIGGETPGTLSSDGRAALPGALPISVPAVLCVGWVLVGFGFHALASSLPARDRVERRAVVSRVGRSALIVLGYQVAILGVLAYLDCAEGLSHNRVLTVATLLAGLAIGSLLQLVGAARSLTVVVDTTPPARRNG